MLLMPSTRIQPIVNLAVMEKNYSRKEDRQHFDMSDG